MKIINRQKVVDLYESGYEPEEIASQFGCRKDTIVRALTEAKVYIKPTAEERRIDKGKIKALRKAGWLTTEIAFDCHCSVADVEEVLNETQSNPA